MKIKKFNESLENIKECTTLIITDNNGVIRSGAFETETDMYNWLLNIINEEIVTQHEGTVGFKNIQGIVYNEEKEPIFIDVADAINWYQDYFDCTIHYDVESSFIKNEPLMYGVEEARKLAKDVNKHNM